LFARAQCVGRFLLPTSAGVVRVQDDTGFVVTFPPAATRERISPPRLFANVFVFLEQSVAELLVHDEAFQVLEWVQETLNVCRFEPSALLPRAVRVVAPRLFGGEVQGTVAELAEAWQFLEAAAGGTVSLARPSAASLAASRCPWLPRRLTHRAVRGPSSGTPHVLA